MPQPGLQDGARWTRKHLLGLESLSADEITQILDQAAEFKRLNANGEKLTALKGVTILIQDNKNLYPLGIPYAFVSNIHHQYVLIFQKR